MKHTPWPWRHVRNPHYQFSGKCSIVDDANGYAILAPGHYGNWIGIPEANARLIALAPFAPHECEDIDCSGHRLRALLMSVRDDVKGILGAEARALLDRIDDTEGGR